MFSSPCEVFTKLNPPEHKNFETSKFLKKSHGELRNRAGVGFQHIIHIPSQPIRLASKHWAALMAIRIAGVFFLKY